MRREFLFLHEYTLLPIYETHLLPIADIGRAAENQQNGLEDAVRYIVLRGLVCGTKREFAAAARMSANNVSFVRGPTMRWSIPTVVWKSDGFGGPAFTRRCSLEVSNQCPLPEDQKPRECADLS